MINEWCDKTATRRNEKEKSASEVETPRRCVEMSGKFEVKGCRE